MAVSSNTRLTFGLYEVDLTSGELWKAGFRIKLQSQPFKVLATLLEKPGQVVTREELQLRLWGKDTVVDFDHSLGTAINKIREALGDSADNPRFIETLARRGYRFIAPVGTITEEGHEPVGTVESPVAVSAAGDITAVSQNAEIQAPEAVRSHQEVSRSALWSLAAVGALLGAVAGYFAASSRTVRQPPHIVQITHNGHLTPSVESMENLAAAVTDGVHLYANALEDGQLKLSVIAPNGGMVSALEVPAEVVSPTLGDISPDGSRLLLRDHLSPESEQPLWVVPTLGGSALRVGNVLAHDATWMPDGKSILFANGNNLYLTQLNSSNPQPYASVPGRAFWMRWEPNGKLLRFTVIDPIAHTLSLWQLSAKNNKPVQILQNFSQPANECCGVWTADNSSYVFQSSHGGGTNLWKLAGDSTSGPTRLTDGPLQFQSPVAAKAGHKIYFLGVDAQSELQRVDAKGELQPVHGFLGSAVRVDYSRDGQWVAWTDSNGQLWRARANGTEQLQVTPDSLDVFMARWSPDASRLAIMAREAGKAWRIYLTGTNGGDMQSLLQESRNAADPSWSPDGTMIVFGRLNDRMGKENADRTLQLLHLSTKQVETLPASEGLFSPRWSPDGKYIAALTLDQRQVRLFNVATKAWSKLDVPSGADPVWSSDSRYLFIHAALDSAQPIDRVDVSTGHVEPIIRLADTRENSAADFVFGGLTVDNQPLIRTRVFTGNVYSLDMP